MLASAVLLSVTSCKDYFELERPEAIPYESVADLESTVAAPYTIMFCRGWSSAHGLSLCYSESNSDIVMMNPYSADNEYLTYNNRTQNSEDLTKVESLFTHAYTTITTASNPLDMIYEAEEAGESLFLGMTSQEESDLMRIQGELHFARGLAYWFLSRAYMPPYSTANKDTTYIPLKMAVDYDPESIRDPYMGTMQEVYEAMLYDFGRAKELLADFGKSRRGYGNTYAASTMLMRLHFIMGLDEAVGESGGHKEQALAECDYILNSGLFTLKDQDPIRAFNRNSSITYTNESDHDAAKEVIYDVYQGTTNLVMSAPICRMSMVGMPTKVYSTAQYTDVLQTLGDPLWSNGLRNYANGWDYQQSEGGLDLVYHEKNAVVYWNPNTIKEIGWATTNDPMDLENYVPTEEAMSDKRFLQLYDFLLGNPEAGTDISSNDDYPMGMYEKQSVFNCISYNAFWCNKYLRGRHTFSTYIPLIRLPEVYLTRASLNPSTRLSDVNEVRERAGLTSLSSATEEDVERERIKEFAFENGDRITYLNAMKRDIEANGRVLFENYASNPEYNPMAGTQIPTFAYPYDNFWIQLPDSETNYTN